MLTYTKPGIDIEVTFRVLLTAILAKLLYQEPQLVMPDDL